MLKNVRMWIVLVTIFTAISNGTSNSTSGTLNPVFVLCSNGMRLFTGKPQNAENVDLISMQFRMFPLYWLGIKCHPWPCVLRRNVLSCKSGTRDEVNIFVCE
jgi:hypothetical protein